MSTCRNRSGRRKANVTGTSFLLDVNNSRGNDVSCRIFHDARQILAEASKNRQRVSQGTSTPATRVRATIDFTFVVAVDRARQLSAQRNVDYPRVPSDSNFVAARFQVAARGTSEDYRPESQSRADRASEREQIMPATGTGKATRRRPRAWPLLLLLPMLCFWNAGVCSEAEDERPILIRPLSVYESLIKGIHDYFNNTCIILFHDSANPTETKGETVSVAKSNRIVSELGWFQSCRKSTGCWVFRGTSAGLSAYGRRSWISVPSSTA